MLLHLNPHPIIILAAHIEEPSAIQNVPNLLVFVQMFVEKYLNLLLVDIAHLLRRNCNLVTILIVALLRYGIDIFDVGIMKM